MAGRGRGRGRGRDSSSIDFHLLGFGNGEPLPAPVLQPSPTYPLLEYKPVPLKQGPEGEYMIALARDFVEFLRYENSFKQNNGSSSMIERFSDKYQSTGVSTTDNWGTNFHWNRLPLELHPRSRRASVKRKHAKDEKDKRVKKTAIDISCKLDELAKLEEKDGDESDEPKEAEEKEQGEDNDDDNIAEEDDDDDEMDDGTDYLNNYFDNGESYFEDEDDKLDDGPVY